MRRRRIIRILLVSVLSLLLGYSLWQANLSVLGRALWSWEVLLPVSAVLGAGLLLLFYLYRGYFQRTGRLDSFIKWLLARIKRLFKKETPSRVAPRITHREPGDSAPPPTYHETWNRRSSAIPSWFIFLFPVLVLGAFSFATYRILDRFFVHLELAGTDAAPAMMLSASVVVIVALMGITFPVGWLFVRLARQILNQEAPLGIAFYSPGTIPTAKATNLEACIDSVKKLIAEDRMEEALAKAEACQTAQGQKAAHLDEEIIGLRRRWENLEKKGVLKVMSRDEENSEGNRIAYDLTRFLKRLQKTQGD